jgi:hypothetical protein
LASRRNSTLAITRVPIGRAAGCRYSFAGSDVNRDTSPTRVSGGGVGRESGKGASTTGASAAETPARTRGVSLEALLGRFVQSRVGYAAADSSRFVRLRFPATPAACSSMSRNGRRLRFPMIFELPLHARTEQRSSSADEFQDVKPRIVVRAVYNSIAVHEYVGRLNNARTVGPMIDESRWLRWY